MHCNWGVLGPGFIATRAVIPAIQQAPKSRVLAVASNNEARAGSCTSLWHRAGVSGLPGLAR